MRTLVASTLGWWLFVAGTLLLFLVAVEVGYRIGRRYRDVTASERKSQTGAVLAAMLALLGFLLAFSFGLAADRFARRKALVLEEANAAGTAFLRADFLPEDQRAAARLLLRNYVATRMQVVDRTMEREEGLRISEDHQRRLWEMVSAAAEEQPRSVPLGLLVTSMNEVIDLHQARVTVALQYRIPPSLVWALYLVALLSMTTLGIHFGIGGPRNLLVTVALVVAFTAILLLIIDLDQPWQRLFQVVQNPMVETLRTMDQALEAGL